MDWQENLIDSDDGVRAVLSATHSIAVIGIKAEPDKPAHYVPAYMKERGFRIIPVPVFYPDAMEMLGEKVYRSLAEIPDDVDLVNIFRRPDDVALHVDDIIAKKPKAVWLQSGIRNDTVAEKLAKAGIKVVQDLCLMVEHRALGARK